MSGEIREAFEAWWTAIENYAARYERLQSMEPEKIALLAYCAGDLRREAEIARLREALELADAALSGANMDMTVVECKVKQALKGADDDR